MNSSSGSSDQNRDERDSSSIVGNESFHQQPLGHGLPNNYQLYIQQPPVNHIPTYYDIANDDNANKKRRTNYKTPENQTKLNAAIALLVSKQSEASSGQKDLKAISKSFGIPYNTLRDNYLR